VTRHLSGVRIRHHPKSVWELCLARQPAIQVVGADFGELIDLVLEKVVGAGDHLVLDDDPPLGLQL
jgi:hypothetical protein